MTGVTAYANRQGMTSGAYSRLIYRGGKQAWTPADVERLRAKVARITRKGDRDA